MNFIESNIIIARKYIDAIHGVIDQVYTADVLIFKNVDESKKCNFDYFIYALRGFESEYFKKDLTFYLVAWLYYDLIDKKASCSKLASILFNLLNNDKDFKYKSKLKIIGNDKIDHCVLIYEDLDRVIVFDPWLYYFLPNRQDLLISDSEYFFCEIEKIEDLAGGAQNWSYVSEQMFINNIKFPMLIKNDDESFIINNKEIKEYLSYYEHEYNFILEKFTILENARRRKNLRNKKGPH